MVAEQGLLVSAQSSARCWAWWQLTWAIATAQEMVLRNLDQDHRMATGIGQKQFDQPPRACARPAPRGERRDLAGASPPGRHSAPGARASRTRSPELGWSRTFRGSRCPESRPRRRPRCRRHTHGRSADPMGAAARAAISSWRVTRRLVRRRGSHCLRAGVLRLCRFIPNPSTRNPTAITTGDAPSRALACAAPCRLVRRTVANTIEQRWHPLSSFRV
jgi:hypothetical protein